MRSATDDLNASSTRSSTYLFPLQADQEEAFNAANVELIDEVRAMLEEEIGTMQLSLKLEQCNQRILGAAASLDSVV